MKFRNTITVDGARIEQGDKVMHRGREMFFLTAFKEKSKWECVILDPVCGYMFSVFACDLSMPQEVLDNQIEMLEMMF